MPTARAVRPWSGGTALTSLAIQGALGEAPARVGAMARFWMKIWMPWVTLVGHSRRACTA